MTRFLLALLALFGIAAQAPAAEARPCDRAAQVRLITAGAVAASTLAAHATAVVPRLAPAGLPADIAAGTPLPAVMAQLPPAVRTGIDRARE